VVVFSGAGGEPAACALRDDLVGALAHLIELWSSSDTAETGVETTIGGARTEATDRSRKRRRDHTVTDPGMLRSCHRRSDDA